MDRGLIEEKLESLRRCVARVEEKRPDSADALRANADLQDILSLNLTRAVQLCVDIALHVLIEGQSEAPGTMASAFDALTDSGVINAEVAARMKKAVGFRNIAVHNYQAINWEIVYNICHRQLSDFSDYAAAVARYVEL